MDGSDSDGGLRRLLPGSSINSFELAAVALFEISAAMAEVENQDILVLLEGALRRGGPRGEMGRLDLDCVDVSLLDDSIAHAMHHGCRTEDSIQLLLTAKIIRRVRGALKHLDWLELRWVSFFFYYI